MLGSDPRGPSSLCWRGIVEDVGISSSGSCYRYQHPKSSDGVECLHRFFEEYPDTLAAQELESRSTEEVRV